MATTSISDGNGVSRRWQPAPHRAEACRVRLHIGHWSPDPVRQHVHTTSVEAREQQPPAIGPIMPVA